MWKSTQPQQKDLVNIMKNENWRKKREFNRFLKIHDRVNFSLKEEKKNSIDS